MQAQTDEPCAPASSASSPSVTGSSFVAHWRISAASSCTDPQRRDDLLTLASIPWSLENAMQYDFVSEFGGSAADWEVLQADLLAEARRSPLIGEMPWMGGLWCFNPRCTNLSGPSELSLKTFECGGGCGSRYCSVECQEQCWRAGHRHSCQVIADRNMARGSVDDGS